MALKAKVVQANNDLVSIQDEDLRRRTHDLISVLSRGRRDPIFFINKVLGIQLHPGQEKWIRETTIPGRKKNVLCPSNQWGKTLSQVCKEIWLCFYKVGLRGTIEQMKEQMYPVLHLSFHSMQAQVGLEYARQILTGTFAWIDEFGNTRNNVCLIPDFLVGVTVNPMKAKFSNNSYILGASCGEDKGSALAGSQFAHITYDEAPQSNHLREELPARIMSRLIKYNGTLDLIGTPEELSKSQAYYRHIVTLGLKEKDGWYAQLGMLDDNRFIPEQSRKEIKDRLLQTNVDLYRQVVYGEFVSTGGYVFGGTEIEHLWDESIPVPDKSFPYPAEQGHSYIVSSDWGFSSKGDPTVVYVLDATTKPYKIVFHMEQRGADPQAMVAKVLELRDHFNSARLVHDSSSMGGTIVHQMIRQVNPIVVSFVKEKEDMLVMLRKSMTSGRETAVENGVVIDKNPNYGILRSYYNPILEEQLSNYKLEDKALEQDHVMSLMMAVWALERRPVLAKPYSATGFYRKI